MAKENGDPTPAEKGKGKAGDEKLSDSSKKVEETKKDKDGKPTVNGKKGDQPQEGKPFSSLQPMVSRLILTLRLEELSEEDQQLKTELEMLVSRLKVPNTMSS